MKVKAAFSLLAVTGSAASLSTVQPAQKPNITIVPNAYIIEFEPDFHPSLQPQQRFAQTPVGTKAGYQLRHEFNSLDIFSGISVSFHTDVDLESVRKANGVKNAWHVTIVPPPEPYYRNGVSGVNQPLLSVNIQKLHDEGIRGKGVQIGIIDSGVDYRHPALGGGFGPGHKIAFGYDFVGDNYDGTNTPMPSPDPLATCPEGGHGTHTLGILAMEDPDDVGFGLVGGAPDATIGAYRVLSCPGSGTPNDIIISAMLRAAEDGADVLSISLGIIGELWEALNPFDPVVTQLAQKGVAVVAAIGNFGPGIYSASIPGICQDALSVGAVENSSKQDIFVLGTGLGIPINDTVANWNTTILLVSWADNCGTGWFQAQDLGVTTIMAYLTSEDQLVELDEPENDGSPDTLYLTYDSSKAIVEAIQGLSPNETYGNFVTSFSSLGPTIEMTLHPKVASPGGTILSTWPLAAGGYAVVSGTSMATPLAAASYALLKSQFPHLTVAQLFDRLKTAASPLPEYNSTIPFTSTLRQGGGMLDVYAAVKADSTISPSEFSLRDSPNPSPQKITITNDSKKPNHYTFSHDPAAFLRAHENYLAGEPNFDTISAYTPHSVPASAQFSTTKLTLQPGESTTITVHITPQPDKYPYSTPVYSGFIKISSDNNVYTIPYMGLPYSRDAVGPITQNATTTIPYASPQVLSIPGDQQNVFSAQATTPNIDTYVWKANASDSVIPFLRIDIGLPSAHILYELVPANTTFVPTIYGFDPSVKIDYQDTPQPILPGFLGVPTYGTIQEYNLTDVEGSSATGFFYMFHTPTLSNNGVTYNFTSGDYRPLARALKWNGNETNPDDYESYLGPVIRANIPADVFPSR
ncbi:subtilase family domain-containing protein [Trichoderma breve]|uniref:Subtilase family domain-containing protein n=1 Tax=Trichoderma breve TaxID=2034170 RepID=A0A9W9E237_9HYPO|nr:subtilase family domain-containing protein [Trichoderma breve]KAJ4855603.1 subtilase family domain-containing protein [Trichoderma breve]